MSTTPNTPSPTSSTPSRRRRKQSNPLLAKIVGVVILVHLIFLPIAAKLGAFKEVQKHFMDVQMVNLPPTEKVKPEAKRAEKKALQKVAHRGPANPANHAHVAAAHQALNQPKVLGGPTSSGSGDGEGGIRTEGDGTKAGQLPTAVTAPTVPPTHIPEPPAATPTPVPTPVTTPTPVATLTPVATPAPVATPRAAPVFTEATPTDAPRPTLPDTLRGATLDATAVAEFTVGADGIPTDVRVITSTGMGDLDKIALDAARQWRFRPATRDGQPVASVVRLHVEFQVL